jgi:hypothetical protein
MDTSKLTDSDFKSFVLKEVHPFILKNILFDNKIEYRLAAIKYLETCIHFIHNIDLFISFNLPDKTVTYDIKNTPISVTISY